MTGHAWRTKIFTANESVEYDTKRQLIYITLAIQARRASC